jgi:hypothetical protein
MRVSVELQAHPAGVPGDVEREGIVMLFRMMATVGILVLLLAPMSSGHAQEAPPDPYRISLKSRSFTPPEEVRLDSVFAGAQGTRVHVLMQFKSIPDASAGSALDSAGIELLNYIPKNSWFASVPANLSPASPALSSVRWIGKILPEDKISPSLTGIEERWRTADGEVLVVVKAFKDVQADPLKTALERHGATIIDETLTVKRMTIAVLPESIPGLASEDVVRWIEPAPTATGGEVSTSFIRAHVQVGDAQSELFLSGDGVTVGILEDSHAYIDHPDLIGRTSIGDDDVVNYKFHATAVAGIIGGDGTDTYDFRGMAPDVELYTYDWSSAGVGSAAHQNFLNDLLKAIGTHHIDIANNSWGDLGCHDFAYGAYNGISPDLDGAVRGEFGRPITIVFSAGNERYGNPDSEWLPKPIYHPEDQSCITDLAPPYANYGTLNHPKSAKNTIVVGAIDSYNNKMSTYSSWGPTLDGRIKPDIVASGVHDGSFGWSGTTQGIEWEHHYRAANYPVTTAYTYGYLGQTSGAAAVTSGAIALLLEDYRTQFPGLNDPLPSTVKALLIHTAKDLDDSTTWYNKGPDYASGWGLLQIKEAIELTRTGSFLEDQLDPLPPGTPDQGHQFYSYEVASGTKSLKVTLAWDDPPAAENAGEALVNDLDLVIFGPSGPRWWPWTLSPEDPAQPANNDRPDHLNNVEQYLIEEGGGGDLEPGIWSVSVYGTVVGDPQKFSLVFDDNGSDRDGDGIANSVDEEPFQISESFNDFSTPSGGTTYGRITSYGSQIFTVEDLPSPQGVRVSTSPDGGPYVGFVNVCGEDNYYTMFNAGEEFVFTCSDRDNDGIANSVDEEPFRISESFNDFSTPSGGTTYGHIEWFGSQIFTVEDVPSPEGVRVSTSADGGPYLGGVNVCGDVAYYYAFNAGEEFVFTCSSLHTRVVSGTVEIRFFDTHGATAETSLSAPNALKFEPISTTFNAPASNPDDVIIVFDDQEYRVSPGEEVSFENLPPMAVAGDDQAIIEIGSVVQLDGSQSYDPDGDDISYAWSFLSRPGGSNAVLGNPSSATPTFVPDVYGEYRVELVVTDVRGSASEPDDAVVSFANVAPVADAGDNQAARVGDQVLLDGSSSDDANGDALTFHWSFFSAPAGSTAALNDPTSEMSTLTADVPGTYEVDLIVSDGLLDSEPARVTVVATTAEGDLVHALEYAVDLVNGLDPAVFKNRSLQKNMAKHIGQALGQIDKAQYDGAREKLEAVARQTDGCANDSEPDRNDWIQQCDAQDQIHPVLVHALGLVDEVLGG